MKNGEKFALLEEGRLSSYEQLNVMGGGSLKCHANGTITYVQYEDGTVSCPIRYKSCTGFFNKNKLTCHLSMGYSGNPGSAGLVPVAPNLEDTIISVGEE